MALHVASGLGVSAIVRKLIQRGHNVNGYDGSGWTPLQNAAFYGHTKVAKELIRAKANVHLKVKGPGRNMLCIAAYYFFQIMMKICILCSRLILNAGVGIDEQDCFFEGRTALMLAAQKGHSAVVAELVKAGADINVKDKNGMTAVLLARDYDVIHQLWIQDAGGLKHLSKEDRSRILWHACDEGDLSMVQSVIRQSCDVDHVHKGQTPVIMATLRGHDRIVKELILANCDVNQHSKGYYSDLRSSLSLGRQFLRSAMVWIAIMVPWFALLLSLGRSPLVAPPWVNAWTGSVALLAAPVCATAVTLLPVSWPALLIWVAVVARVVMMMMVVAAAGGPVVVIMAAAIATVVLWARGLRATLTPSVNAKNVAFVVCSAVMAVAADAPMIVIFVLFGLMWLVPFISIIIVFLILVTYLVIMLVSTIADIIVDTIASAIVFMLREQLITGVVILFFCTFCINGPTWSWIEQSTDVYNLLVFNLLLWIVISKAPDATALHYAAGHNHIKCGRLLVEAGADMSAKNRTFWTPLIVKSKRMEDEVKKTLSFAAKRTIAVIGNEKCGKSTLITALVAESKNWWMKVINYFRKVHDIRKQAAGIDLIKFSSQKYGETMFYDFAGQSQYHGPHQSFLEAMMNKPEVTVTLLLLVKAVEEEDTITQQLHRWLQPLAQRPAPCIQVIVIGSFSDQVQSKKETYEKLLRCMQSVQTELNVDLQGPCLLDCRYAESSGINQICSFLKEVPPMNLKSLSYNLHWMLVQLRKAFSTPAVRLDGFQTWREKNADENLPRKLPSSVEVCQDLSATGHTLFLHNQKHSPHSWLILDLPALLHDVYGTLFSGTQGKGNQFGLLHCSQLTELFPKLDQELIQSVLISLEFCFQINPLLLEEELLQLTIDEREEGWLYFPALVSTQPCKVFPKDPDPDQVQWMCWQLRTEKKHFFSPHLLQTIILRLATKYVFIQEPSPSVREHSCNVWKNGLSWSSTKGVNESVQISDSSVVQVIGCSKAEAERLQEYTAAIVQDVIKTINQLSPKLEATPYIVHPYTHTLWEDPKAPQPHSLYPVLDVITCISRGDNHIPSLSPNTSSVPIGQLFGGKLPSLSTIQHLDYPGVAQDASPEPSPSPVLSTPTLNELNQLVVWRVAAQWYPLGLSLGVEPAVLATVKADHPGDVEGACRDLLCRWLSRGPGTGEQPRVWLSVLTAIRETVGKTIAEEVEREAVPSTHTMSLTQNTSSVPIVQLFGEEPPSLSTVQCLDYPGVAQDAAEAVLDDLCWTPFGIQSQSVGSEGGKLSLEPSDGAIGEEVKKTVFLKVPPGAISPADSVEVRSALIPDGPFTLPEGYQLGSMVVYLCYDGRRLTKPITLSLPHWYGGEDQVRDGLTFAMAPHTLKEGESVYNFELVEGGKMLGSHCGELEIDGHSSMFAVVFRKGAVPRYQAISLQKQKGDETRCHVAVTFADPLWRGILKKYRSGWTVDEPSCSFTFGEDGELKGKLRQESGNGWSACINMSHELRPYDVEYATYGITDDKRLKRAVTTRGYPPTIKYAVAYKKKLRRTGRPVWVHLDLQGAAGRSLTFVCKAYEERDCQQLDGGRNAAVTSQSRLTPPPDMVGTLNTTPPQAETAGQSLAKRVLMKWQTHFYEVVAVKEIYRELFQKHVIPQTVADKITDSRCVKEARGHLFDHMLEYGTLDSLKVFCDVITSEEYVGYSAMQDFGVEMRRRLEQEDINQR